MGAQPRINRLGQRPDGHGRRRLTCCDGAEGCGVVLEVKGKWGRGSLPVRIQESGVEGAVVLRLSGVSVRLPSLEDAISHEDGPREDLDNERAGSQHESPAQPPNFVLVCVPQAVNVVGESAIDLGHVIP